jgi:uncharacterized cofD-like protein
MKRKIKFVSIGSISAARILVEGFRDQQDRISAIVPTTDTGSSTGVIRERFKIPAPGDVRAVLATMGSEKSERSRLLRDVFEYRLSADRFPELGNMALGNIILAALTDMSNSFSEAVRKAGSILDVAGKVMPVTSANAQIKAILYDGKEVVGEREVRRKGKAPIRDVMLDRNDVSLEEGIAEAIEEAEMIVIGPGCLYTSVVACLVVPGFSRLISLSKGKKIFCCNTTTTPGQTDGLAVLDHVITITRYLNNTPPDYVLINSQQPQSEMEKAYQQEGVFFLVPSDKEVKKIEELGSIPILADFIEEDWSGKRQLHKVDTIRHDPQKVREALMQVYWENIVE